MNHYPDDHHGLPVPRSRDDAVTRLLGWASAKDEARQSRRDLRLARRLMQDATALTDAMIHHVKSRAELEAALGGVTRARVERELGIERVRAEHERDQARIRRDTEEILLRTKEIAWDAAAIAGEEVGGNGRGEGADDRLVMLVKKKRDTLSALRRDGYPDDDPVVRDVRAMYDTLILRMSDA